MKYIIAYTDNDRNIYIEPTVTCDMTLAEIECRLKAYRKKGEVLKVKYIDYDGLIKKAINSKSLKDFAEKLKEIYGENIFIDHIKQYADIFNIKYEEARENELWYLIDGKYIISFISKINVYGISEISEIILYDKTDSILSQVKLLEEI